MFIYVFLLNSLCARVYISCYINTGIWWCAYFPTVQSEGHWLLYYCCTTHPSLHCLYLSLTGVSRGTIIINRDLSATNNNWFEAVINCCRFHLSIGYKVVLIFYRRKFAIEFWESWAIFRPAMLWNSLQAPLWEK